MAERSLDIVKEFLVAFSRNELEAHKELLSEDAQADFSAIGLLQGRDQILKKMRLPEDFSDQSVTIVNALSYEEEDRTIISLIGQHFNAYEDDPYLFAVVFGGQYAFVVKNGRIEKIVFVLEYQAENTYYLHEWKLSNGHNDYSGYHSVYDGMKQLKAIEALNDDCVKAEKLTKLLFSSMNTKDLAVLDELLDEDASFSREKTYSSGVYEAGKKDISEFLSKVENYYDLNEYGIRVNSIKENDAGYLADIQLLSPQRLNTKKLQIGNRYHSFYDEAGHVQFDRDLKVREVKLEKVADIYYNGFDLLEV